MVMRKWALIVVGFLMLVVMIPHPSHVCAVEMVVVQPSLAMFVLGDSSVECGDNTPFYHLLHGNLSLYPCNGSDSTLLPHLIGRKMGLAKTTPFYTQNGSLDNILHGVNFGSASATILYPNSQTFQSLNQQLRQAFDTIQLLRLHIGQHTTDNFIKSSIFYISFGKDDFIDYFLHNLSSTSGFHYNNAQDFIHILVHQITNAIRSLYDTNVRNIICAGILPLGCTPRLLLEFDTSPDGLLRKGCIDDVNNLILEYNTRLEESLVAVNAELHDTQILFCDVYRAMMEFINNPNPYGIEDVGNACCGVGRYGGMGGCVSPQLACLEAATHVWWDLYNPTPTVNALVADSAWSGQPVATISRPFTVQQLLLISG